MTAVVCAVSAAAAARIGGALTAAEVASPVPVRIVAVRNVAVAAEIAVAVAVRDSLAVEGGGSRAVGRACAALRPVCVGVRLDCVQCETPRKSMNEEYEGCAVCIWLEVVCAKTIERLALEQRNMG